MPTEYNNELPRFARQITFVQGRTKDERSDDTIATTGILRPFTGLLEPLPGHEFWRSSKLSYLTLQPFIVRELTEAVREVHHSTQQTPASHQTEAAREQIVLVLPPLISRPTTGLIEEQTSVERANEPQTRQRPPRGVTNIPETVDDVDRGRPSLPTPHPELRVGRRAQTAASETVSPGVLHRIVGTQQTSRGQGGRTKFEVSKPARRTFLGRSNDLLFSSASRPATPERSVDQHTTVSLNRWPDQPTPSRENAAIERQGSSSERDGPSDSIRPNVETESRVREKLAEASGQPDFQVALTTRSLLQPSSETSSLRRGWIRSPFSRTAMTVLETGTEGNRTEPVLDDKSGDRKESARRPIRTDRTLEDASKMSRPSLPDSATAESRRSFELTLRRERTFPEANEQVEREDDHPLGATSEHRQGSENNNQPEKHISSLPATDDRHTDPEIDLDRLVDRLFTKFERKMRIERERRGL